MWKQTLITVACATGAAPATANETPSESSTRAGSASARGLSSRAPQAASAAPAAASTPASRAARWYLASLMRAELNPEPAYPD